MYTGELQANLSLPCMPLFTCKILLCFDSICFVFFQSHATLMICSAMSTVCTSVISSTSTLLPEYECPRNCSCAASTITCNGTIPDTVPPDLVDVVLLDPVDWAAGKFCDVNWTNVREVSFIYLFRTFLRLQDYAFYCLNQIETFRIRYPYLTFNGNAFAGLTNVVMLDLSDTDFVLKDLTNVFAVPARLPKLAHINVSMNRQIIHLDQNFIDALSSRPVEILDFSETKELIMVFNDSRQLCEQLKTLILHDSSITVKTLPDK